MKSKYMAALLMFLFSFGAMSAQDADIEPGVRNEVVVKDSTVFLVSTEIKRVPVTPELLEEQSKKLHEEIKKGEQYLTDLRANLLELERVKAVVNREYKNKKKAKK
jgi:hypothetical protein